jgi:hypothetical protein
VTRGDGERPYNTPKKKRGGSIKNREEQSKKGEEKLTADWKHLNILLSFSTLEIFFIKFISF